MYRWNNLVELYNNDKMAYLDLDESMWLRIDKVAKDDCERHIIGKKKTEVTKEYENLLQILEGRGIIFDGEAVEKEVLSCGSKDVQSVYFLPTLKCNMECDFCCMECSPQYVDENAMNIKQIESFIEELADTTVSRIILTGGEPFVHPQIDRIIDMINEKVGCRLQVCTNGLLVDEQRICDLKGKIKLIDISVENLFEDEYIYEKEGTLESFEAKIVAVKKAGIRLSLSYVATRRNYKYLFSYIDFCYKHDAIVSVKYVMALGAALNNLELVLSEDESFDIQMKLYKYVLDKKYFSENIMDLLFPAIAPARRCAGSGNMMAIYPDGKVYSCYMLNYENFSLGNVKTDSMANISESLKQKSCSKLFAHTFDKNSKAVCKDCDVKYFCEGHCSYVVDDIITPNKNPSCKFFKGLFHFLIWDYRSDVSYEENLRLFLETSEEQKRNRG